VAASAYLLAVVAPKARISRRTSASFDRNIYKLAPTRLTIRALGGPGRHDRLPAQASDLLGHASIVTTERYDNQRLEALQAAVARLEAGKAFDAITDATENLSRRSSMVPAAKAEVSRIFQVSTEQSLAEGSDGSKEISTNN
jgi:hypothetical protein